jgi:hypothetical protein
MSDWYLVWIIPLFFGGFVGLWILTGKALAWAGWGRLKEYTVSEAPAMPARFGLFRARVGVVSYKNVIRAGVGPQGLALSVVFLFRIGHPPLLIPGAALGPVTQGKRLWRHHYRVDIRTARGSVPLEFDSPELARALQAALPAVPPFEPAK